MKELIESVRSCLTESALHNAVTEVLDGTSEHGFEEFLDVVAIWSGDLSSRLPEAGKELKEVSKLLRKAETTWIKRASKKEMEGDKVAQFRAIRSMRNRVNEILGQLDQGLFEEFLQSLVAWTARVAKKQKDRDLKTVNKLIQKAHGIWNKRPGD